MGEAIVLSVILFFISTISWLSDREIKKSLKRARKSEAELKEERDSLEVKVEQKSKELQRAQMEKISQIHRFAEFGRLSSGLFHDLANPLSALAMKIEEVKFNKDGASFKEMESNLEDARKTAIRIEKLIGSIKKQISNQEVSELFSLNDEINDALEMLAHRARKNKVNFLFLENAQIKTQGNPIKFNQIVINLVANAIDAYPQAKNGDDAERRRVEIMLDLNDKTATLAVKDRGTGIPADEMGKIFEPFYTSKQFGQGLGIGLPLVKEMAEKDFGGKIQTVSNKQQGTVFTFTFNLSL
jgi:two-component system C4-dicarboxylate transport sensor histidine kinase DctB